MPQTEENSALPDIYKPYLMTVDQVIDEAPGIRTLRLKFQDPEEGRKFSFKAGQFGLYSIFGEGEAVFCIASSASQKDYIECSFQKVGRVTTALRELNEGDTLGFRGPYGNHFPLEEKIKGHNVLFVGMGIGLAPVRCVLNTCLDDRKAYKDLTVVYGARNADLMVYKPELAQWAARDDLRFIKTVDVCADPGEWDGEIGVVGAVLEKFKPSPKDAYAVLCGPPIGIKFTLPVLLKLGFPPENIYTTLENRMKCGLGKCGRCNVGPCYVCKDGPVFSAAEMAKLPQEF